MISVQVTPLRVVRVNRGLEASSKASDLAQNRAINLSASWAITHSARRVAAAVELPVGVIKRRLKLKRKSTLKQMRAVISFGMNPVALSSLNPRQTKRGVRAKKHFVPSGFIAAVARTGQPAVWKRRTSTAYPIVFQKVEMEKEAKTIAEQLVLREAPLQFRKFFEKDFAARLRRLGFTVRSNA